MAWEDNNTGTALYADPVNGGVGYQDWVSSESGNNSNCGYFNAPPYGTSPAGNIISGLQSPCSHVFGLYGKGAGTNTFARAFRSLKSPLMIGGNAVVRIGANYRNGAKGVRFKTNTDSPNETKFLFQLAGNKAEYYKPSSGYVDVSSTFNYVPNGYGYHIDYQRITSTTGAITIQQIGTGPGSALSIPLGASDGNLGIDQLEFFCGETDLSPNNENNFYFNLLSAYNAWR